MPAVHEGLASLDRRLTVPGGHIIRTQKSSAERGLVMDTSSIPILQMRKRRPGKDMPWGPSLLRDREEAGVRLCCLLFQGFPYVCMHTCAQGGGPRHMTPFREVSQVERPMFPGQGESLASRTRGENGKYICLINSEYDLPGRSV